MEYVIYSADTKTGTIINMTHNPSLDFAYLRRLLDINCIKILTPNLSASHAEYVLKNMVKDQSSFMKAIPRSRELNEKIRYEVLKNLMHSLDKKPLKRPEIVASGCSLPSDEDMLKVHQLYEGRIRRSNEVFDDTGLFLESSMDDIVQMLYLEGKAMIVPSFIIDKPGKKYICSWCGREIKCSSLEFEENCDCGNGPYYEPYLAFSCEDVSIDTIHVKYKQYRKLDSYQARASAGLAEFMDEETSECLLWTVPGSENERIFLDALKKVLNRGGRAAVVVSYSEDKEIIISSLREVFPGLDCLEDKKAQGITDGILVCDFTGINGYYKAFDLAVIYEKSAGFKIHDNNWYKHMKRAVKEKGKVIYATSSPGSKMYASALKSEIKLVTVPLRSHGKPTPEPRILQCRGLSFDSIFIPGEVTDFINWSVKGGMEVGILLPYLEHTDLLKSSLINSGIDGNYFSGNKPHITIASCDMGHIYVGEAENIIVFFADDEAFGERELINAAGLAGKLSAHGIGQVMFVGSKESEEMYNAKMMIRELNRNAWDMGYLK